MTFSANEMLIAEYYIAAFGRTPDQGGLDYWVSEYESGNRTLEEIRDIFTMDKNLPEVAARFPVDGTTEEFVTSIYVNVLGRQPDQGGLDYWLDRVNADESAENYIPLNELLTHMLDAAKSAENDAATLSNKLAAAEYMLTNAAEYNPISVDTVNDDISTLNAITDIIDNIDFHLTSSVDEATSHVFYAIPGYTPGGNDLVNTLQDEDELTGTFLDNDELNVTIGSVNDNAENIISPILNSVEIVNASVTAAGSTGISFESTTGVETVNIERITATNADVSMEDLQDSTDAVSIKDATREGTVEFNWAENSLNGTEDDLTVTLNNVIQSSVDFTQGDNASDAFEDEGYGFENITINTVEKAINIDTVTIDANAEEERASIEAGNDKVEQTITINADVNTEINRLNAEGAENINIDATGNVLLTANERTNQDDNLNYGLDRNDLEDTALPVAINASDLEDMTITGSGKVTINGISTDANSLVIDGSTMSNTLAINIDDNIVSNSASSLTSGSGNDEILVDAYDAASPKDAGVVSTVAMDITTNDGADLVSIGATMTGEIDTGAGTDTVTVLGNVEDTNIATGADADELTVTGDVLNTNITTDSGDDIVDLQGDVVNDTTADKVINTGTEDDTLTIAGSVLETNTGSIAIETEAGDDNVTIGGNSMFTGTTSFFTVTIPGSMYSGNEDLETADETTITLVGVDNGNGEDLTVTFSGVSAADLEDAIVNLLNGDIDLDSTDNGNGKAVTIATNAVDSDASISDYLANNQLIYADPVAWTTGYFELATDNVTFAIEVTNDNDGDLPAPAITVTQNDTWQGTIVTSELADIDATIDTAEGDDTVSLHANTYDEIDLGVGSDTLTIDGNAYAAIRTGTEDETGNADGQDSVYIQGMTGANASIDTFAGDDTVTVVGDANGDITTAAGDDTVVVGGVIANVQQISNLNGDVSTGDGSDSVTVSGNATGAINTAAETTDGSVTDVDTVDVAGNTSGDITTGIENDTVEIGGNAGGLTENLLTASVATGDIDLGTGSDTITIGGDLNSNLVTDAEAGNTDNDADYVTVAGKLAGTASITTADGNDVVTVGNLDVIDGDYVGNQAITTEAINGAPWSYKTDAPAKTVADSNIDLTNAADISTGAGDDIVTAGSLYSAAQYNDNVIIGNGNDDDTVTVIGATIDTGSGNDVVSLSQGVAGSLIDENASLTTGEGNDTVTASITNSTVLEADNAKTGVYSAVEDDTLGAKIDLGEGDDELTLNDNITTNDSVSFVFPQGQVETNTLLVADRGAVIDGGEGNDSLTINTTDSIDVVKSQSYENDTDSLVTTSFNDLGDTPNDDDDQLIVGQGQGGHITGVETINLNFDNTVTNANAIEDVNDVVAQATFTLDVEQVDSALTTINLTSLETRDELEDEVVEGVEYINQTNSSETDTTNGGADVEDTNDDTTVTYSDPEDVTVDHGFVAGQVTNFVVDNFRDDANIEINVSANEVTGLGDKIETTIQDTTNNDPDAVGFDAAETEGTLTSDGFAEADDCETDVTVAVNMDAVSTLAVEANSSNIDENRTVTLNLEEGSDNNDYDIAISSETRLVENINGSNGIDGTSDEIDARYARDMVINVNTTGSNVIDLSNTFGDVADSVYYVYEEVTTIAGVEYVYRDTVEAVSAAAAIAMVQEIDGGTLMVRYEVSDVDGDTLGYSFSEIDAADAVSNYNTNIDADAVTASIDAPEVETSLTVNGGTDGEQTTLTNVQADNVTVTGASDTLLYVDASNDYTITTGSGDDVINMTSDIVDENDTINGGEGFDTLVIGAQDINLNSTLDNIVSIERVVIQLDEDLDGTSNIEVNSNITNTIEIVNLPISGEDEGINDDDNTADVHYVNIVNEGTEELTINANVNNASDLQPISCPADYDNTHSADLRLTVDTTSDTNINVNMSGGTQIDLTTQEADVIAITAEISNLVNNYVGSDATNTEGNLDINTTVGSTFDSLTLHGDANDSSIVTVMIDDSWATDSLTIDASQITDATSTNVIDGSAETDAELTIYGTTDNDLNANTIVGGNDIIIGGDRNDTIYGLGGADNISGGQGNDTIEGGTGNDVIMGETGNDTIDGGTGSDLIDGGKGVDTLTGGADADTFKFGNDINPADISSDSNAEYADTINDFETGSDVLDLQIGLVDNGDDVVDLSSFATVTNVGQGNTQLEGTINAPVIGASYYALADGSDEATFAMDLDGDGDITASDFAIISTEAINASDVNVTLQTGDGNDLIRLGEGVSDIDAGAGDDKFVILGNLTQADLDNYEAAVAANGDQIITQYGLESVLSTGDITDQSRTTTEAVDGSIIDGGAGNDTLYVYGTADLTGMTLLNVQTIYVNSHITLTIDQLNALTTLEFGPETSHTIEIVNNDGTPLAEGVMPLATEFAGYIVTNGSTITIIEGLTTTTVVGTDDGEGTTGMSSYASNAAQVAELSEDLPQLSIDAINGDDIVNASDAQSVTITGTCVPNSLVTLIVTLTPVVGDVEVIEIEVEAATDTATWSQGFEYPSNFEGTVEFSATSTEGNDVISNTRTITVDNVIPTLDDVNATIAEVVNSSETVDTNLTGTLAATDGFDVTYEINGGTLTDDTYTLDGMYGTLTVNALTGEYTYAKDTELIESLDTDEVVNDTFYINYTDENGNTIGGEDAATLNVEITGANDLPVLEASWGQTDDYVLAYAPETGGTVSVNGSVEGTIETAGDIDAYMVYLEAGQTYSINLEGDDIDGTYTLDDTYLRGIYDGEDGSFVGGEDDDGGFGNNSYLEFTPDSSGMYGIQVGGYGEDTGTFRLSVTENDTGSTLIVGEDEITIPEATNSGMMDTIDTLFVSEEQIKVTNDTIEFNVSDVDANDDLSLVDSVLVYGEDGESINNGEPTTFDLRPADVLNVTDLKITDGTEVIDLNTQLVVGSTWNNTFDHIVPTDSNAIFYGMGGEDTFDFLGNTDDGIANEFTIADYSFTGGEDFSNGGDEFTYADDEDDDITGAFTAGDVVNIIFDNDLRQSDNSVYDNGDAYVENVIVDRIHESTAVTSSDDYGNNNATWDDEIVSFTLDADNIGEGDILYISSIGAVLSENLTNYDYATVSGAEYTQTFNLTDSMAEQMLSLQTALDDTLGYGLVEMEYDNSTNQYHFSIASENVDETIGHFDLFFDDISQDDYESTASRTTDAEAAFSFDSHYDYGDEIYVSLDTDGTDYSSWYYVTTYGGVSGTEVANWFANSIDGSSVSNVSDITVTGTEVVITLDTSDTTSDKYMYVSVDINEEDHQSFDTWGYDYNYNLNINMDSTYNMSFNIIGTDGDDIISGGYGFDTFTTGLGNDIIVLEGNDFEDIDVITDYSIEDDAIVVAFNDNDIYIDANTVDSLDESDFWFYTIDDLSGIYSSLEDAINDILGHEEDATDLDWYASDDYDSIQITDGTDSIIFFDTQGNDVFSQAVKLEGISTAITDDWNL